VVASRTQRELESRRGGQTRESHSIEAETEQEGTVEKGKDEEGARSRMEWVEKDCLLVLEDALDRAR